MSVVIINQFFNTRSYAEKSVLDWEVSRDATAISKSANVFLKTYEVQQTTVQFKDSWLYNYPFSNGTILTTYAVVSKDFSFLGTAN